MCSMCNHFDLAKLSSERHCCLTPCRTKTKTKTVFELLSFTVDPHQSEHMCLTYCLD